MEKNEVKKEKPKKKRMGFGKFCGIVLPISFFSLALGIALPVGADIFNVTLDTFFKKGETKTIKIEGSEKWDTQYVERKYQNSDESRDGGFEVAKKIADEGITLLKNDGALPLAKNTKIAPFGYGYSSPVYGGTGSGKTDTSKDYIITPQKALRKNFEIDEAVEKITLSAKVVETLEATGTASANVEAGFALGGDNKLKDIDPKSYDSASLSNASSETAVMFISRSGGEGFDVKSDAYKDGTPHKLALSSYEKETLNKIKSAGFKNVVVIINSSNVIELDPLVNGEFKDIVNSILWVGGPGGVGFESMSDILCGEINPSGRTVDIYEKNLIAKRADGQYVNPALNNFGNYQYKNASSGSTPATFLQYEEGIYLGYRYYETASKDGNLNYDDYVLFPFGYGLSYTSFEQTIKDWNVDSSGNVTLQVEVKNTGTKAGKDLVQIYFEAPWDVAFAKENKIEKSSKNLIDFAKSNLIEPGKSETVSLTFPLEDMASYSYNRTNPDGTKGSYVLEKGKYNLYLGKNSHDSYDFRSYEQKDTIWYDSTNPRQSEKDAQSIWDEKGNPTKEKDVPEGEDKNFLAASNRFESSNSFMSQEGITNLTRTDWNKSQPTQPTDNDKNLNDPYLSEFKSFERYGFDYQNNPVLGNGEESKIYSDKKLVREDNGATLSSYRGLDYNDPAWDTLMNQINFDSSQTQDELRNLLYYGAYNTAQFNDVGKIDTEDFDGPQGFSSLIRKDGNWCTYPSEVVVASSYNTALNEEYGLAIGQEGLETELSGWYGPALNIHRSPFSGRNYEYYSEDPVLSGKMAAAVISGASTNGVYGYIKHFAVNDQETNRMNYLCTWANEQALREIYLKPFEICVKEAKSQISYTADAKGNKKTKTIRGTRAIMTAYNCIGPVMASCNYDLLTNVLRKEWGFQGAVITDFAPSISPAAMVRSGNDFYLGTATGPKKSFEALFSDTKSTTARNAYRKAVKNISYMVVNSNAYNNVAPGSIIIREISPWRVWFYAGSAVLCTVACGGFAWTIFRYLGDKKLKKQAETKSN